ncbi:uncharacterized protein [Chelonus insularis]|uniref:uncharacterized protein n=1 Tax=Chelonus insularis TaxID=460826 RepID=UPI00158BF677|nr:uncharacterized protein LOC118073666 [Chelonus insularis]
MTLSYFCLRYILLTCFIFLGISGLVVCAVSGFFIYQFHGNDYPKTPFNYLDGPPAILLVMGILVFVFSIYFWYIIDYKFNRRKLIMFSVLFIIIAIVKICSAVWVLVIHEQMDKMLSQSLKKTLAVQRIKDGSTLSNFAQIKLTCCGYNETIPEFEELTSWLCCNFERLDNTTKIMCKNFYGQECQHLALNTERSILHHIFLLALCSIIFQIFITSSILICGRLLKKGNATRIVQYTLQKPSAPPIGCN